MFHLFFTLRYLLLLVVIGLFSGSILMIISGGAETLEAFSVFFSNEPLAEEFNNIARGELAVLKMIGSVGNYLSGLVFLIFSYGIYMLYIHDHSKSMSITIPNWLIVKNIEALKKTLAQVIVIILFVKFLEIILTKSLVWEDLIIPISIVLLSIGLKFLFDESEEK